MFAKKEGLTLGKRVLLPALALCGGAAGFCLRKWQWLSAYDRETELFIEGAPATYALLALLAVVAVALLVLGKMLKQGFVLRHRCFCPNKQGSVGQA